MFFLLLLLFFCCFCSEIFCDLQRVSCWSLLGRKTSSEQPLAPYLHGSPIIPTIFSNAWFGASTNVCLQILQLFNPCDFLILGRISWGTVERGSLARQAVEVALPALGNRGRDQATALQARQQGQQVLVLHKTTAFRSYPCNGRLLFANSM